MSAITEEIDLYKQALTTCKDILNAEAAATTAKLQFMASTADLTIKQLQDPTFSEQMTLEDAVAIASTVGDVTSLVISVCTDRNLAVPQCVTDAHHVTADTEEVLEFPTQTE